MGFLKKAIDFVARPTHSRTMGLAVTLVLVAAVSLTVIAAQQQQQIRQRAAAPENSCTVTPRWDPAKLTGKPYKLSFESGPKFLDTVDGINDTFYRFNNVDPGAYTFQISSDRNFIKVTAVADCGSITSPACASSCNNNPNCITCGNGDVKCDTTDISKCPIFGPQLPPTSTCSSYGNINKCIEDNKCAWGKLPGANPTCYPTNNILVCPAGFAQWYWQDSTTNECAPSQTAASTIPACSSSNCEACIATSCPADGCKSVGAKCVSILPTPTRAPNLFSCVDQIGLFPGEYQCSAVLNGTVQCSKGYEYYYFDKKLYTDTSCVKEKDSQGKPKGCCIKSAPTPTPTPTPASMPVSCSSITDTSDCISQTSQGRGNICRWCINTNACISYGGSCPQPTIPPTSTLVLALNAQDVPSVSGYLSVELALYNLTTNLSVTGAPSTQRFTLTPIPGKQYSANISLANLQQDKYFIVVRKDNMIAKSVFTVSNANERITVPTATLVFGDINNDSNIDALDYNLLRSCYKKTTPTCPGTAALSDFDKNNVIDQIDFNTLIRGWTTWDKQGKENN